MNGPFTAFVDWPSAALTKRLVTQSLQNLSGAPSVIASSLGTLSKDRCLQWSTYDSLDHDLTLANPNTILSSSYTIRKALIRKHFLHRCIQAYTAKNPSSILTRSVPKTWDIDISYADELEDAWGDELWDLANEIDSQQNSKPRKWWILKPSMADRGMGIRLFDSKQALRDIFEDFDESSDSEESGPEIDGPENDTGVITSQLRHFVIQEYLSRPMLIDPHDISSSPCSNRESQGRKFHLRVYCVASGDLTVYIYTRVLALFSALPYSEPVSTPDIDLRPHLTNTCLQVDHDERNVCLLDELVGCRILSSPETAPFTESSKNMLMDQVSEILANTFEAASQMPIHFQALPNAFELFGVDFLVSHESGSGALQVNLLEINAEPAIEMTGDRLMWVLEDLFKAITETCINPFYRSSVEEREGGSSVISNSGEIALLRECYRRQRWT